MKVGLVALAAAAAMNAGAAELVRPICNEPGQAIAIKAPANQAVAAQLVFDYLERNHVGLCIQRGPNRDTWVLFGSQNAMLIGVLPVGKDRVPYLQVWPGRYQLIGPMSVQVIAAPALSPIPTSSN